MNLVKSIRSDGSYNVVELLENMISDISKSTDTLKATDEATLSIVKSNNLQLIRKLREAIEIRKKNDFHVAKFEETGKISFCTTDPFMQSIVMHIRARLVQKAEELFSTTNGDIMSELPTLAKFIESVDQTLDVTITYISLSSSTETNDKKIEYLLKIRIKNTGELIYNMKEAIMLTQVS